MSDGFPTEPSVNTKALIDRLRKALVEHKGITEDDATKDKYPGYGQVSLMIASGKVTLGAGKTPEKRNLRGSG